MKNDTLADIVAMELNIRITRGRDLLDSAQKCLISCDYLQAAVRINELEKLKLDEFQLRIMDIATNK